MVRERLGAPAVSNGVELIGANNAPQNKQRLTCRHVPWPGTLTTHQINYLVNKGKLLAANCAFCAKTSINVHSKN